MTWRFALSAATLPSAAAVADTQTPRRWTPPEISTAQYESTPAFTPDGAEMYYMFSDRSFQNYRLMWSRCDAGRWSRPQPVPFAAPPPALEADPFITADGKRLYFVSSRRDPTQEDLDIWYVERQPAGRWGDAQRMPEPVNSSGSELLPRVDDRGRLYFGSDRPGGAGAGDIYVATRGEGDAWRVENLGAPVNTAAFEYEAEISRDGRTLILVADRGDHSHLYRFALIEGRWLEQARVPALPHVFQVGPLLSPRGDRLLFAQADAERSGEFFVIDLAPNPDTTWPPTCRMRSPSSPSTPLPASEPLQSR